MERIALLLSVFTLCFAQFNPASYANKAVLLANQYNIYWTINNASSTIQLALEVKTSGWIGFGLGEPTSGSMPGSDMLIGMVTSGTARIEDRYALEKATPLLDDCQSWKLIGGSASAGWTIIEVERKLDTGDVQDRPFTAKTRIIFAWGMSDVFGYHDVNRHISAVTFWGPVYNSSIPGNPAYTSRDFLNSNYTIPVAKTTYYLKNFYNLGLPQDVHVVRVEPVFDAAGKPFVHHFLVYGCHGTSCKDVIWGWAPGIDPMDYPPEAGLRVGPSASAWDGIQLQIHYNNPSSVRGVVDNSGIRAYYSTTLRRYDADILELGDPVVTNPKAIPQGNGVSAYEYNCPSECTSKFTQPLNVFGSSLHMHQRGNMMWTTHWRNGNVLGYSNRIEFWDFELQQTTPKNYQILPGDRLNTHCVYNQNPSGQTVFSVASSDEMCLEYVYYYPRLGSGPFCSFVHYSGNNFTACGALTTPVYGGGKLLNNPSVTDPAGGEIVTFGKANPSTYVCQGTTVTRNTDAVQSDSVDNTISTTDVTGDVVVASAVSTVAHILSALFIILAIL